MTKIWAVFDGEELMSLHRTEDGAMTALRDYYSADGFSREEMIEYEEKHMGIEAYELKE